MNSKKSILSDPYFSKNKNKPNVDVSLCRMCNLMTDQWYISGNKIIWECKKCCDKQHKQLEDELEHMCNEKS